MFIFSPPPRLTVFVFHTCEQRRSRPLSGLRPISSSGDKVTRSPHVIFHVAHFLLTFFFALAAIKVTCPVFLFCFTLCIISYALLCFDSFFPFFFSPPPPAALTPDCRGRRVWGSEKCFLFIYYYFKKNNLHPALELQT